MFRKFNAKKSDELIKNSTSIVQSAKANVQDAWLQNLRILKSNLLNQACEVKFEPLKDKVLLLYFTASWCQACKAFNERLKVFYDEAIPNTLEIIVVPIDCKGKFKMEQKHKKWAWVEAEPEILKKILEMHKISFVPALLLVRKFDDKYGRNVRADVQNAQPGNAQRVVNQWRMQLSALAEKEISSGNGDVDLPFF
ncbi:Tryparedoxin [Trichinella pseudospiralis]|uniref:protein-disulfide reductase n=1 Tax=Trichinella pseudospiralis TaxID=6337 RepID=A0A0V1KAP9_TRIPS|nr:Tryparedoxin [Trichinella pseudospiralis]KRZ28657.1 Tryparedoxin [Trichinella pseudospiralis]KRZ44315.1 Tryparedoxin [Trichinella pseudospiralis]